RRHGRQVVAPVATERSVAGLEQRQDRRQERRRRTLLARTPGRVPARQGGQVARHRRRLRRVVRGQPCRQGREVRLVARQEQNVVRLMCGENRGVVRLVRGQDHGTLSRSQREELAEELLGLGKHVGEQTAPRLPEECGQGRERLGDGRGVHCTLGVLCVRGRRGRGGRGYSPSGELSNAAVVELDRARHPG